MNANDIYRCHGGFVNLNTKNVQSKNRCAGFGCHNQPTPSVSRPKRGDTEGVLVFQKDNNFVCPKDSLVHRTPLEEERAASLRLEPLGDVAARQKDVGQFLKFQPDDRRTRVAVV